MHQEKKEIQQMIGKKTLLLGKSTGVLSNTPRELFFFFYASNKKTAEKLSEHLKNILHYEVYPLRQIGQQWAINGSVNKEMVLFEEYFDGWIEQMNELAKKFHADFDGWEFPLDVQ